MFHRLALVLCCICTLPAAVWYVDVASPGSPKDGLTWNKAFTDPQSAFDLAQPGDQVWVADGTYYPSKRLVGTDARSASFFLSPGVSVYGGFSGNEVSAAGRSWQIQRTILSGDLNQDDGAAWANRLDNSYHVVVGAHGARLDGFIVRGGNATPADGNCADSYGAGLRTHACPGGSATPPLPRRGMVVANCLFEDNYALLGGGGVAAVGALDVIQACVFRDNQATSSDTAHPGVGGGLAYWGGLEVSRCIAYRNTAEVGGGIHVGAGGPLVLFANLIVAENTGTGIVFDQAQVPLLVFATIFANVGDADVTTSRGGGLRIVKSKVTASHCLVTGNMVVNPGVAYIDAYMAGTLANTAFQPSASRIGTIDYSGGGLINEANPISSDPVYNASSADPCGADLRYFTADDGYQLQGGGGLNPSGLVPVLAPACDILGRPRGIGAEAGAYEFMATGGVGESTGPLDSANGAAVVKPTVSLISPTASSVQSAGTIITLTATASSAAGIREVRFYEDDILLGSVSSAPFTGTRAFPGGTHSYRAIAIGGGNVWTESTLASVTDGGAPGPSPTPTPTPSGGGGGGGGGGCGAGATLAGLLLFGLRRRR